MNFRSWQRRVVKIFDVQRNIFVGKWFYCFRVNDGSSVICHLGSFFKREFLKYSSRFRQTFWISIHHSWNIFPDCNRFGTQTTGKNGCSKVRSVTSERSSHSISASPNKTLCED